MPQWLRCRLDAGMPQAWTVLALAGVGAGWPVWPWLLDRLSWYGEALSGLAALAGAAAVTLVQPREPEPRRLLPLAVLALPWCLYVLAYDVLPPLLRASLVLLGCGIAVHVRCIGRLPGPAVLGLLVLATPLIPSLQFLFGYPARIVAATLSQPLLWAAGLSAVREGAALALGDRLIQVDPACSGIRMFWTALFLALVLAGWRGLSVGRLALLLLGAGLATLVANAIRIAALVQLDCLAETSAAAVPSGGVPTLAAFGVDPAAPWLHDGVGLVAFAGLALTVALMAERLRRCPD